jgi:hypothetical protein
VADSCEHGNEHSDSIKAGEFIDFCRNVTLESIQVGKMFVSCKSNRRHPQPSAKGLNNGRRAATTSVVFEKARAVT